MLKLGVNIDHVATLREARYRGKERGEPDPIEAALICEAAGAHGITAHLREDRRHILDRDVWKLREVVKTRLNLEMANAPEIVEIALKLKPHIVCLVPEKRQELTTEGGLDAAGHLEALKATTARMKDGGVEVSLFIDPDLRQVEAAAAIRAEFIELHTGTFAEHFHRKRERADELQKLADAAEAAHQLGVRVNAGHGLNYQNVAALSAVPHLVELNIGHSIISRSITVGLAVAVKEMLLAMESVRPAASMILGVGIDIVEVARIRASHERFGDRFLGRILRPGEIEYCLAHRDSAPHLAARFAAKEAISKAFGTGIGQHLAWHDMEIRRKESGEPYLILHDQGLALLQSRQATKVHISLSHTAVHAVAMAVLESLAATAK